MSLSTALVKGAVVGTICGLSAGEYFNQTDRSTSAGAGSLMGLSFVAISHFAGDQSAYGAAIGLTAGVGLELISKATDQSGNKVRGILKRISLTTLTGAALGYAADASGIFKSLFSPTKPLEVQILPPTYANPGMSYDRFSDPCAGM